jgi:hypothetical protein
MSMASAKAREKYESFSEFDRLWFMKNPEFWVLQGGDIKGFTRIAATMVILFRCTEVKDDGNQT